MWVLSISFLQIEACPCESKRKAHGDQEANEFPRDHKTPSQGYNSR